MFSSCLVVDIGGNTARIGLSGRAQPDLYDDELLGRTGVWDCSTDDVDAYYRTLCRSPHFSSSSSLSSVLISESTSESDSLAFKSRLSELLFEHQSVPRIGFQFAPVLSCFAHARQSALVLDMSAGGCTTDAVLDGWLSRSNREHSDLGAIRLDAYLTTGSALVHRNQSQELAAFRRKREEEVHRLPDGTQVRIAECLLNPGQIDSFDAYFIPLPELVLTSATKNAMANESRKQLLHNIVLCGGISPETRDSVLFTRLEREVKDLFVQDSVRLILGPPTMRNLSAWVGGSILAGLPIFEHELCLSKQDYLEWGQEHAILKKFPT